MRLESWAVSDIGLVRKSNQDFIGCFPELGLYLVADGMGGRSDGERASHLAVDLIHGYFETLATTPETVAMIDRLRRVWDWLRGAAAPAPPASDPDRLRAAIESANAAIFDEAVRLPESQRARSLGTTVVALKFKPEVNEVAWGHVGDSRLYRLRDGELALLTADHTMFGEAYRDRDDVPTDLPHTNVLVQALGIREEVLVPTVSSRAHHGDMFLLCSDGVSGLVDPGTIREQLADARELEATGRTLIQLAMDAGGKDNASLILLRVVDE